MNEKRCCCSGGTTTILACSGGSNVGQITNEVAKKLDIDKVGKFFCLAGVGGHIRGMVASVEGSDRVLVLDGCPVACAKMAMEQANINGYEYLVVTELGIEKVHDFNLSEEHIGQVAQACLAKLNGPEVLKEDVDETKLVETTGGSDSCGGSCGCSCN